MARMISERLSEDGYALVETESLDDLLSLARQFGTLKPEPSSGGFVHELRPMPADLARKSSMTSRFGMGAFPFHTDAAYLSIPPRFTFLRCARDNNGDRPTFIVDSASFITEELQQRLMAHIWQVSIRPAFYCSLIQKIGLSHCLRWDPNILRAAHRSADDTTNKFRKAILSAPTTSIFWHPGLTLVIDNWRILHARAGESSKVGLEDRILHRVHVISAEERS